MIALQYCFGFCHDSTWISPRNMYAPSLLNLLPISHLIQPLQVVTEHQVELPALYSKFPLTIKFTYGNVCVLIWGACYFLLRYNWFTILYMSFKCFKSSLLLKNTHIIIIWHHLVCVRYFSKHFTLTLNKSTLLDYPNKEIYQQQQAGTLKPSPDL